eukprot:augustus_masked-scaffold_13-processed-gene-11.73-mRNA-1 protein AED:0.43 eAED:0.44 QI:0/-1/0/1/-1/1/1/0/853
MVAFHCLVPFLLSLIEAKTLGNHPLLENLKAYEVLNLAENNNHLFQTQKTQEDFTSSRVLSTISKSALKDNNELNLKIKDVNYLLELSEFKLQEDRQIQNIEFTENGPSIQNYSTSYASSCIYEASGSKISFALFFMCNGEVSAKIKTEADTLFLQNLEVGGTEVIAYSESDLKETDELECGGAVEDSSLSEASRRLLSEDIEVMTQQRARKLVQFVEVLYVNDHSRFQRYTVATFVHTLFLHSLVNELYQDFPGNNEIDIQVSGVITFTIEDPWSPNRDGNSVIVDDPSDNIANGLLSQFGNWLSSESDNLAFDSFDVAHLISGEDFTTSDGNNNVVGLAKVPGVCRAVSGRIGTTQDLYIDSRTTTVIAHEIGHNLGFRHTNVEDPAGDTCDSSAFNFIMDASGTSATDWSSCSREWWQQMLDEGDIDCTNTASENPVNGPVCGNGMVEDGEECDCGLEDCSDVDPCCNGAQCEYVTNAVCAANDPCCDLAECTFASAGTVCREKRDDSDCDTEEVCSGTEKSCPEDVQTDYGESCSIEGFSGRCFRGECISRGLQCSDAGHTSFCQTNGDDVCSGEGDNGLLCRGSNPSCTATSFPRIIPIDGSLCESGKGCYKGDCIDYSLIPQVDECQNLEVDGSETDVDCGGDDCLPCTEGKLCINDDDCFGTCDVNTTRCVGTAAGEVDTLLDLIREWFEDSPLLFIAIVGFIASVIVVSVYSSYRSYRKEARRVEEERRVRRMSRASRMSRRMQDSSVRSFNRSSQNVGNRSSQRVRSSSAGSINRRSFNPDSRGNRSSRRMGNSSVQNLNRQSFAEEDIPVAEILPDDLENNAQAPPPNRNTVDHYIPDLEGHI